MVESIECPVCGYDIVDYDDHAGSECLDRGKNRRQMINEYGKEYLGV
jgi:hypothetical protein